MAGQANLSRDNAEFVCWNTDSDSLGVNYQPNSMIQMNGDIVLYAIWHTASASLSNGGSSGGYYTLRYEANGATLGTVPIDYTHYAGGEQVTVAAKGNLAKEDCTFVEWNTKRDGIGVGYQAGSDILTMPKSDVVLYAVWVDPNGHIIYASPDTGESDTGLRIACRMTIFSVLAMAAAVIVKRQKPDGAEI